MNYDNLSPKLLTTEQLLCLERRFRDGLHGKFGYVDYFTRDEFPVRVGHTLTTTKRSRLIPKPRPVLTADLLNINSGITPDQYGVEQVTISPKFYDNGMDYEKLSATLPVVETFPINSQELGENARQTIDRLGRNQLFADYMGGNTWVTETLAAPGTSVKVDDVRGFDKVYNPANSKYEPVSVTNPLTVYFDDGTGLNVAEYECIGYTVDVTNTSKTKDVFGYSALGDENSGGISGTLVFSTNVAVLDGTIYNSIRHEFAPLIIRPAGKTNFMQLTSTDKLTLDLFNLATTHLHDNGIPTFLGVNDGLYLAMTNRRALGPVFNSDQFKYQIATHFDDSHTLKNAMIEQTLGIAFRYNTEAVPQTLVNKNGDTVRVDRIFIGGTDIGARYDADSINALISKTYSPLHQYNLVDGIAQIVRGSINKIGNDMAQSWAWAGGFVNWTDGSITRDMMPTSIPAHYKRAVIIETVT